MSGMMGYARAVELLFCRSPDTPSLQPLYRLLVGLEGFSGYADGDVSDSKTLSTKPSVIVVLGAVWTATKAPSLKGVDRNDLRTKSLAARIPLEGAVKHVRSAMQDGRSGPLLRVLPITLINLLLLEECCRAVSEMNAFVPLYQSRKAA